jgi:hypothetical protein
MNVTRPAPDAFAYLNSEPGQRFDLVDTIDSSRGASRISSDMYFYSLVNPTGQTKKNSSMTFPAPNVEMY